jgi:hypothetical protein
VGHFLGGAAQVLEELRREQVHQVACGAEAEQTAEAPVAFVDQFVERAAYQGALQFAVQEQVGQRDRLLLVPGNHDVDRGRVREGVRHIQEGLLAEQLQEAIAELLQDDDERDIVLKRHAAYARWFHTLDKAELTAGLITSTADRDDPTPLAENPLLLTALCVIHGTGGRLPETATTSAGASSTTCCTTATRALPAAVSRSRRGWGGNELEVGPGTVGFMVRQSVLYEQEHFPFPRELRRSDLLPEFVHRQWVLPMCFRVTRSNRKPSNEAGSWACVEAPVGLG